MAVKPFLGVAYYPEDWDEAQIPEDIAWMQKAGITCARIAEFAWRKMEPAPGQYEFGWLHRVIDALREAGIAVVLGTPTATPPIWLAQQHPKAFTVNAQGVRAQHGARRSYCSNNPDYQAACERIVEAMGKEFGHDPAVIGWQLDNEIYTWPQNACCCEYCTADFHRALQEKYGTVELLNQRWDLNLFSQAYDNFDQVQIPTVGWHNPHVKYEWAAAHYKADMRLIHRHAELLHRYTDKPIGTDMMPFNGMDYEEMTAPLDVVEFNHYNDWRDTEGAVFWFDYLRTLKEVPFWNTETAATWTASVQTGLQMQPEGWCRMNSWLPVALGGEGNMYWLFRQHWAGHELMHGSVLSACGRPTHTFGEIQRTAAEMNTAADLINSTGVHSEIAVHFTSRSWQLFNQQPIVPELDYQSEVRKAHAALCRSGFRPDVIGARHSLDGYKLLFSPLVMTLEDSDMGNRITEWVKAGGIWVVGPMTDIRNDIGAHFTDRAMGTVEQLLGIRLEYAVPNIQGPIQTAWNGGEALTPGNFVECYSGVLEPLAKVTGGHSALNGLTVVGKAVCGKGQVIVLGCLTDDRGYDRLVRIAADLAGIEGYQVTGTLQIIPRIGKQEVLMLCETGGAEATIRLKKAMRDLLTGKEYHAGVTRIHPWDILILQ